MKILTWYDIKPEFRSLFFEQIEAKHLVNKEYKTPLDCLFIAGKQTWERKKIVLLEQDILSNYSFFNGTELQTSLFFV